MEKIIGVTLGGLIFHVEEKAYRLLESYLAAVENHFRVYDDREEITQDIENRIAEIFTQRTGSGKAAVTSVDVREVIRQIGTVEDFEHFDEGTMGRAQAEPKGKSSSKQRRLFRDPENSILGGVAAGVAAYFGMDITLIRVIFILFAIVWGVSILVYLVLWAIMPPATTTAEKMQMKGEPVTLAGLEEKIRAKMSNVF